MSETQQLDPDGVWRQSIPLPFFTRRLCGFLRWREAFKCIECGREFDSEQAYRDHYRPAHPTPAPEIRARLTDAGAS